MPTVLPFKSLKRLAGELGAGITLVAESLPKEVEDKVASVEDVTSAKVNIVFDPPWDKDMMSEEAKLELGFL